MQRKYVAVLISILIVGTVIIYLPTIQSGFIWDDLQFLLLPLKMGETPYKYFFGWGVYYRPFIHVVNTFDYSIWHLDPRGWHITNIVINTFNSFLMFVFSLYFLKYKKESESKVKLSEQFDLKYIYILSFLSAILFTVNPLHVESIAWISGRTDPLATLMIIAAFLSLTIYLRTMSGVSFVLVGIFFLFGLFSKENAIALIILAFAYCIIMKAAKKQFIMSIGLLLFITAIYFIVFRKGGGIRELVETPGSADAFLAEGLNLVEIINRFIFATGYYFEKLVLPINLNLMPNIPNNPVYYLLFVIPFIIGIVLYIKKLRLEAFMFSWGFLALIPSLAILYTQIALPIAERYLYTSSVGFTLFIVMMLSNLKSKRITIIILSFIAISYTVVTVDRLKDWKDDKTLWEVTVKQNPASITPALNYASALFREKEYDKAREYMLKILQVKNLDFIYAAKILHYLGKTEFDTGNSEKAEEYFNASVKAYPKSSGVYNDLGTLYYDKFNKLRQDTNMNIAYLDKANIDKAIEYFQLALKYSPEFIQPKYNLGLSYLTKAQLVEAEKYFKEVIRDDPQSVLAEESASFLADIETVKQLIDKGKIKR